MCTNSCTGRLVSLWFSMLTFQYKFLLQTLYSQRSTYHLPLNYHRHLSLNISKAVFPPLFFLSAIGSVLLIAQTRGIIFDFRFFFTLTRSILVIRKPSYLYLQNICQISPLPIISATTTPVQIPSFSYSNTALVQCVSLILLFSHLYSFSTVAKVNFKIFNYILIILLFPG